MSRKLWGLVALAGALFAGCGGDDPGTPEQAGAGLVGSLETVRTAYPETGAEQLDVVAGRGGYASLQVVLQGGSEGLTVTGLEVSDFNGRRDVIAADNATVYEERLVDLPAASDVEGAAGPWPDALVPVEDAFYGERRNVFPLEVAPRESRALWVDVHVPAETRAGPYEGTLTVGAEQLERRLGATIRVADAVIEPEPEITTAFGLRPIECQAHGIDDCAGEEAWKLRALYVRAALDDHIGTLNPALQTGTSEASDSFRRWVLPLIDGSPLPGEGRELKPATLVGARPQRIQVDEDIGWWRAEAEAGGFADRALSYPCDEPGDDKAAWRECIRLAQAAKAAWPGLPTLVTASARSAKRAGALDDFNILATLVNQLEDRPGEPDAGDNRAEAEPLIASGGELWTYNSCLSHGCDELGGEYYRGWPSFVVDQPATAQRAMGPLAFRYDTSGELYYAMNRDLRTAWEGKPAFGATGDGTLFYPGLTELIGGRHEIPVESIRLKRIRDGLEDNALLTALAESGHAQEADRLAAELVPRTYEAGEVDPAVYERFRARADELLSG